MNAAKALREEAPSGVPRVVRTPPPAPAPIRARRSCSVPATTIFATFFCSRPRHSSSPRRRSAQLTCHEHCGISRTILAELIDPTDLRHHVAALARAHSCPTETARRSHFCLRAARRSGLAALLYAASAAALTWVSTAISSSTCVALKSPPEAVARLLRLLHILRVWPAFAVQPLLLSQGAPPPPGAGSKFRYPFTPLCDAA